MNNNDITLINKDSNNKGGNKFTQLLVILVVILLIVVVAIDILVNNVDFKDIFSQTITWIAGNITYLFVIPLFLFYIKYILEGKYKNSNRWKNKIHRSAKHKCNAGCKSNRV